MHNDEKLLNFYATNFEELNTVLKEYGEACSEMSNHIKNKTYDKVTKEEWCKIVDKYRKVHRKMLSLYRYIPSEGEMENF